MTKGKMIYTIIITLVFCIMTLGYAALQQKIDIEAEANIDSTYRVEITKVEEGTVTGNARSTNAPQYNGLNASFYVGLTNTTDTITYTIEITNYSTVDVRLNNTEIGIDGSSNIEVKKIGIRNGDIMNAGSLKVITIKVKLKEATSSEQTGTINIRFDFDRLKGGTGEVVEEVYSSYKIGDKITFAGSDWYVIEDSGTAQDYVVLLKETVLTNAELGTYAPNSTYDSARFGSTTDYETSNVKEAVEKYIIEKGITEELKQIDKYKIRLITTDEVINNLGWTSGTGTSVTTSGNNVPKWVYQNFGGNSYWTMTSDANNSSSVWYVHTYGNFISGNTQGINGVRPVINLYKTAITSQ